MSGIMINIKAGATVEESSVTATGQLVNIIANSERGSFGIGSDSALKRAVEKYFGKWPNDAYLHSPTPPCGDLYKRYGWPQVQRVLIPVKAQILGIKAKPSILSINTLKNESSKTATFATKISEQVTNSASTEWSNSSKLSIQQMFQYKIGFLGTGGGGETSIGFEQTWGKSETVTKQTTTGMEASVTVELLSGQSATAELCASSGTMHVRITYDAHLIGYTAVNYNSRYRGHHYWALPIGNVLYGSNRVRVVEDIEVGYYSNASVKVKNAKTNEEMMFHMTEHSSDNEDESSSNAYPDEIPSAAHHDEPASE